MIGKLVLSPFFAAPFDVAPFRVRSLADIASFMPKSLKTAPFVLALCLIATLAQRLPEHRVQLHAVLYQKNDASIDPVTKTLLRGLTLLLMPLWALAYVWPGTLVAVLAGAVVGYAGLTFFVVAWDTALQDHIPHHLLARVSSWDLLTSFLAMPIGNALAGPLSEAFGINRVLVVCAAVLFVAGLVPLMLRSTRRLTRRAGPAVAPAVSVPVG